MVVLQNGFIFLSNKPPAGLGKIVGLVDWDDFEGENVHWLISVNTPDYMQMLMIFLHLNLHEEYDRSFPQIKDSVIFVTDSIEI